MKTLITALVAVFLCLSPAIAWELEAMNRTIDTTNFIVDDKRSGTLVDIERRLILTNYHCVEMQIGYVTENKPDANGIVREIKRIDYKPVPVSQKSYLNSDLVGASKYMTDIVAVDENTDLALLRIKAVNIPQEFASRLLPIDMHITRGEVIYIVGNPTMLDASVVGGIVSSLNRRLLIDGKEYQYIQVSGGVTGGNSGGALYNDDGYFIGIPAAASRRNGFLGFAIPIWTIREFLTENCQSVVFGGDVVDDDACREKAQE